MDPFDKLFDFDGDGKLTGFENASKFGLLDQIFNSERDANAGTDRDDQDSFFDWDDND